MNRNTAISLPWNVFVLTARERIKLGYMDAAVRALDWIREYGYTLSGSALEVIAELHLAYENKEIELDHPAALNALVAWAKGTDAGKSLWDTFISDEYQSRVVAMSGKSGELSESDVHDKVPDVFEAARAAGFSEEDIRSGRQQVIFGDSGMARSDIDQLVQGWYNQE